MMPTLRTGGPARTLIAALGVFAVIAGLAGFAAPDPVVATADGPVRGSVSGGIAVFKGIPFAAPPVGPLRWREPQPAAKWSEPRDATHFGKACMQLPGLSKLNGGDPGPLSEDCLTLNVWSNAVDARARRPVIVWIYGGAYAFGGSALPLYDGSNLARRGVVFVSLNYRLGALGFFAHPALAKAKPGGPANFGLLDQVAALRWVKANIANFGGDPDNVTLMGQSAGAKSVLAHMASPLSRGLFSKAIVESAYIAADATMEKALKAGAVVATTVGLKGAAASLDDLRAVPAKRFAEIKNDDASLGPVPIAGDEMLPRPISDVFDAGEEAAVPLICGNTSDEASVLVDLGIHPEEIVKSFGVAGFGLRMLYPGVKGDKTLGRQALRDMVFTLNTHWLANRHTKQAPTWRYYFGYSSARDLKHDVNGVPHGGDIPFFLDTLRAWGSDKSYTDADRSMANETSAYVVAFATTGKPDVDGSPAWSSDGGTLVFAQTGIKLEQNFMRARLTLMQSFAGLIEGLVTR